MHERIRYFRELAPGVSISWEEDDSARRGSSSASTSAHKASRKGRGRRRSSASKSKSRKRSAEGRRANQSDDMAPG